MRFSINLKSKAQLCGFPMGKIRVQNTCRTFGVPFACHSRAKCVFSTCRAFFVSVSCHYRARLRAICVPFVSRANVEPKACIISVFCVPIPYFLRAKKYAVWHDISTHMALKLRAYSVLFACLPRAVLMSCQMRAVKVCFGCL